MYPNIEVFFQVLFIGIFRMVRNNLPVTLGRCQMFYDHALKCLLNEMSSFYCL